MACKRYEILLINTQGQAKQKRGWTEAQLLGSVGWLKRMNARGHAVLIRPATSSGLVLLDRLTRAEVSRLEQMRVPYSAKVEVEQDRFQIWLNLGRPVVGEKIARVLSARLKLEEPEAGRFGMLAGFLKHQTRVGPDRERFVLSHEPAVLESHVMANWQHFLKEMEKLTNSKELDRSMDR